MQQTRKKGKRVRHRTPASFWDNLSYVPFVKRALKEFDRRSKQPICPLPPLSSHIGEELIPKLKQFAKHGGPNLSVLRGYPSPKANHPRLPVRYSSSIVENSMPTQIGPDEDSESTTRGNSQYDEAFLQHLLDYGLRVEVTKRVEERPSNWEEILVRLGMPRRELSRRVFTDNHFAKYDYRSFKAVDKDKILTSVIPIIIGKPTTIPHGERIAFKNLQDLTDGSLAKAKPDFYDGSDPSEIDQRIREKIGTYVLPVKIDDDGNDEIIAGSSAEATPQRTPCLPNLFIEVIGAKGDIAVGCRLAFYHGLLGARGIHELRSLIEPGNVLDNRAYTITSVYHNHRQGSSLRLYTVHPICLREPSGNPLHKTERIGYRICLLGRWELLDGREYLIAGSRALRNARDFAADQRERLIEKANMREDEIVQNGLSGVG